MTDNQIIQEAITYIEGEGRVNITSLLKSNNIENSKNFRADQIACQLEKTGMYVIYWLPNDSESILVKRNQNFELNENIKETNVSVQKLNNKLVVFNTLTIIIATLTMIFIALQFWKTTQIAPQATNKLLKQIVKSQDSIKINQRRIDSSLWIMADSISSKKHF